MVDLFILEFMTILGITMVLLFLDSRFSLRHTVIVVYCTMVFVMAAVTAVYKLAGAQLAVQIYSLIAHVPSLLLFLHLSRFRGWRLLFQLLSAILFCMLIQHGSQLVYYLSGNSILMLILSYIVFSAVIICFLLRFLRPLFFQALLELRHGWWFICLVILAYYWLIVYLFPGYVSPAQSSIVLKSAISLLMVGFYTVLMFLFSSIKKEAAYRRSIQLSTLQLSGLERRIEAVKAAEDNIRRERHDLRHRLQVVSELVSLGDKENTLKFLNAAQERLDEPVEIRRCKFPILDAVFSSFFSQAQRCGINVEERISLPDKLPVDEGELAIVLANALENAIHANMELASGQQWLHCRVIGYPNIMLEIVNPYLGPVRFDTNGFPLTSKEGHGLGTQSIRFFCEKYGAVCQYESKDGIFTFRIVL